MRHLMLRSIVVALCATLTLIEPPLAATSPAGPAHDPETASAPPDTEVDGKIGALAAMLCGLSTRAAIATAFSVVPIGAVAVGSCALMLLDAWARD
jgi:hypothetical protein